MIALALRTSQPLVVQNDGSGVVLPLGVYPPGSDLSAFTIFEPSSGESVSGAGYIVSQPSLNRAQLNDSETEEDDPGDPPLTQDSTEWCATAHTWLESRTA